MSAVPEWLKSLRLHKYTGLVSHHGNISKQYSLSMGQLFKSMVVYIQMMSLTYEEMLDLSEEKLEKMGVTKVNYHLISIDPKMI